MNKRFIGLAAILAFASGAALAQDDGSMSQQPPSGGGQQPMFNQLDSNQDGTISQDEAKADPQLEQNWAQADKNGDGSVDQAEFSAFEEEMTAPSSPSEPSSGS